MKYRSEEIDKINAAQAKAQGAYKQLVPNEMSPHGKYANLAAILLAVEPALADNGLAFDFHTEIKDDGDGAALLWSTLNHESGQFKSSVARAISGETIRQSHTNQEIIKRAQACMVLGIAPSANDPFLHDDNGADEDERLLISKIKKPLEERRKEKPNRDDTITTKEYNGMMMELDGFEDIAEMIQKRHGIDTLADLPSAVYYQALSEIRRLKGIHDQQLRK